MEDIIAKANSWPMYALAIIFMLAVLSQCVVFMIRSWREGIKLGMSRDVLKKTAISSITFSVLPSVGILIGVLALAPALGLPLPWMRLSVVGNLTYESSAATNMAKALGLGELPSDLMTAADFASIALNNTLGIILGILFIIFFYKSYSRKISTLNNKNPELMNMLLGATFIAMISTYMGDACGKLRLMTLSDGRVRTPNILYLVACVGAFLTMMFFNWLIEKKGQKWLKAYAVSFAMVIGMALAVGGQYVFPNLSAFVE